MASDPLPPETSISPYDVPMRSLRGLVRNEGALNGWIQGIVRGGNEEDVEDERDADEEDDDDLIIGAEEEPNGTLVAQLTDAIRNIFSWFGGGRQNLDEEDEDDNDHRVD